LHETAGATKLGVTVLLLFAYFLRRQEKTALTL